MKLLNTKKGQALDALQAFILGVVGVTFVLVIGLIILAELQVSTETTADYCGSGYVYNASAGNCYLASNSSVTTAISHTAAYTASGTVLAKLATVPTWLGIIIVVALAFIVLGFFYARGQAIQ